jgi:predicted metal-dependent hydrolase
MDNKPNPRVIEKALRDAGLSRKDATAASALLKQIIEQRDAESAKQPANLGEPDAAVKLLEALQYRELLKAIATR